MKRFNEIDEITIRGIKAELVKRLEMSFNNFNPKIVDGIIARSQKNNLRLDEFEFMMNNFLEGWQQQTFNINNVFSYFKKIEDDSRNKKEYTFKAFNVETHEGYWKVIQNECDVFEIIEKAKSKGWIVFEVINELDEQIYVDENYFEAGKKYQQENIRRCIEQIEQQLNNSTLTQNINLSNEIALLQNNNI